VIFFILLAVVIISGILLGWVFSDGYYTSDKFLGAVLGFLGSLLVGLVLLGGFAIAHLLTSSPEINTYDLVALNDSNRSSGQFFLGTGYVDGSLGFNFYLNDDGVSHLWTLPSWDVEIHESDTPAVSIIRQCSDPMWFPFGCAFDKAVLYVPDGTIDNSLQLDAR
jgi:hypothetical protein